MKPRRRGWAGRNSIELRWARTLTRRRATCVAAMQSSGDLRSSEGQERDASACIHDCRQLHILFQLLYSAWLYHTINAIARFIFLIVFLAFYKSKLEIIGIKQYHLDILTVFIKQ